MAEEAKEEPRVYDLRSLTEVSFQIIVKAGESKSTAMLALYDAKDKKFKEARSGLELAEKQLIEAEKEHFQLIRDEAGGTKIEVPLILMHAEDQLMSTQAIITLIKELVDLREEVAKNQK